MRKILFLFALAGASILAQPPITGTNPTVSCTNCPLAGGGPYHIGNIELTTQSGPPGSITGSVTGDQNIDTTAHQLYVCQASPGPCTAVGPSNWQPIANAENLSLVSVAVFGVNGNSSTDPANFQTGLNTLAGVGCLWVPPTVTANMGATGSISIIGGTCLQVDGNIISTGLTTPGVGVLDIPSGAGNIIIRGYGMLDGGTVSPVGVTYAAASTPPSAAQAIFTTGSMIWAHGPLNGIEISGIIEQHVKGYGRYWDASTGTIQNVKVHNTTLRNNRPNLFGTNSGTELYFGWTGGELFQGPGATYNFQHVVVDRNTCQNVTGNCFWSHTTALSLLNQDFTFSNNVCIDHGGDCTQPNTTEQFTVINNHSTRGGQIITSDVGATRVGGPMWDQNVGGACPSMFDGGIGNSNGVVSGNVADSFNGCLGDLDGTAHTVIANNVGTSCFVSLDPLAQPTLCGPYSAPGTPVTSGANNYTRGFTTNNSQNYSGGDTFLQFIGNHIYGTGGPGLALYGLQYGFVSDNTINMQSSYGNPIMVGNISTQHATGNTITKNSCWWSPTSGAGCVAEDDTYGAMTSSDINIVNENSLNPAGTNMYEFQKSVNHASASSSGALNLTSVTAGVTSATGGRFQVEGGPGPGTTPSFTWETLASGAGTLLAYLNAGGMLVGFTPGSPATPGIHFSNLPSAVSFPQYFLSCDTCTPGTSPCTGSGTGSLAYSNGGSWMCPGIPPSNLVTGTGTANYLGIWSSTTAMTTNSNLYESGGILFAGSGIVSAAGVQATGFNPTGYTGASVRIQIGCTLTAGNCTAVYFAVPGGGSLPCPEGGPSTCTYYSSFTTHGGPITCVGLTCP